jgi:hypothetical protein
MRFKNVLSLSTVAAFLASLMIGCGDTTSVPLAPAPPATSPAPQPLPKEVKRGGGPGASGNMTRDPGADPLEK